MENSKKSVTVPTLSLNGSDGKRLQEELEKSARAIQVALGALQETAPHGRDYRNEDELYQAVREYRDRMHRLVSIRSEIASCWEGIQEQIKAKKSANKSVDNK